MSCPGNAAKQPSVAFVEYAIVGWRDEEADREGVWMSYLRGTTDILPEMDH